MYSCGEVGREMADQVLMRVPLRLDTPSEAEGAGDEAARIRAGRLAAVLKDINETCFEYQREEIRRMVCRVRGCKLSHRQGASADLRTERAAQTCIRERKYGLAISYCTSAEDWVGLGRVVDLVLEEYIGEGQLTAFCRLLDGEAKHHAPSRRQAPSNLPSWSPTSRRPSKASARVPGRRSLRQVSSCTV